MKDVFLANVARIFPAFRQFGWLPAISFPAFFLPLFIVSRGSVLMGNPTWKTTPFVHEKIFEKQINGKQLHDFGRSNNFFKIIAHNYLNHNYNKILKSDWLSTALISALIGQLNRTVIGQYAPSRARLNGFFFTASKKTFGVSCVLI